MTKKIYYKISAYFYIRNIFLIRPYGFIKKKTAWTAIKKMTVVKHNYVESRFFFETFETLSCIPSNPTKMIECSISHESHCTVS